jgi:HlyD family secretion protein
MGLFLTGGQSRFAWYRWLIRLFGAAFTWHELCFMIGMKTTNEHNAAKTAVFITAIGAVAALAAIFGTAAVLSGCGSQAGSAVYEYTQVSRGTLEKTVSSSGTLKPVATVEVLPRMSGKVEKVYVDYNALVKSGDVLAELNTDMLRLQREQQLAAVVKARANYELQLLNYQNQAKLADKNLISEYELKTSKTTLDIQAAELAAAEANLKAIDAEINQYAYITSPIDGIVLERAVNVGDTVVEGSSSNSSAIFTVAENLTEMRIESWVGELDIASIREGQQVRFTLESLPGRGYTGAVESKRLLPTVQNNVVSYSIIINVENQDGSLLPGMTCAVEFIEERSENILLVPNAALRFEPSGLTADEKGDLIFNAGLKVMSEEQQAAALAQREEAKKLAASSGSQSSAQTGLATLVSSQIPGGAMMGGGMMGGPGGPGGGAQTRQGQSAQTGAAQTGTSSTAGTQAPLVTKPLWYMDAGGKLDVIIVSVGSSDGTRTEVRPLDGRNLEDVSVVLRERVSA